MKETEPLSGRRFGAERMWGAEVPKINNVSAAAQAVGDLICGWLTAYIPSLVPSPTPTSLYLHTPTKPYPLTFIPPYYPSSDMLYCSVCKHVAPKSRNR